MIFNFNFLYLCAEKFNLSETFYICVQRAEAKAASADSGRPVCKAAAVCCCGRNVLLWCKRPAVCFCCYGARLLMLWCSVQ